MKEIIENPERAAKLIHTLCYMLKDLMIMVHPYMPQFSEKILSYFGKTVKEAHFNDESFGKEKSKDQLDWNDLGKTEGLSAVGATEVFFTPLDQKTADAFKAKFAGRGSHFFFDVQATGKYPNYKLKEYEREGIEFHLTEQQKQLLML